MVHQRGLGWGYLGMAAARSAGGVVTFGLMVLAVQKQGLLPLVWAYERHKAPPVLHRPSLCRFLRVALPAALVMWLEWWASEFVIMAPHVRYNPYWSSTSTVFEQ